MEIISTIALISINETLIVQVISFLIFLFLINRIMFRPLRSVMTDRDIYIERVQLDIVEAREKMEDINRRIEEQETDTRKEALEIKAMREETGNQQAREIIEAVREEIASTSNKTQKEIDNRIAEARQSLEAESMQLSLKIIEKILERRLAT
jgi:F-type H+-transporting ATPase subunit b